MDSVLNKFICIIYLTSVFSVCTIYTQSYEDILVKVTDRITNEDARTNINYIDSLSSSQSFNRLSCYQKGKLFHYQGVCYYLLNEELNAINSFENKALYYWKDCPQVSSTERANTIYNIGISHQYTDQPFKAKQYIDKALLTFEKDTNYNALKLAKKYYGAADYYSELLDILRAETYFNSALNIYQNENENLIDQLDILNKLIILNNEFNRHGIAIKYFNLAINLHKQHSNMFSYPDIVDVYLNGAIAYFHQGEYEEAESNCTHALQMLTPQANSHQHSVVYQILGQIALEKDQFDIAEEYLAKMIAIRTDSSITKNDVYLANAFESVSKLFHRKKEYAKSINYIDQAISTLCTSSFIGSDNNPIISHSFFAKEIDLIRILSEKATIVYERFKKDQDPQLIQSALMICSKMDSLINRNVNSTEFEYTKLQLYKLISSYYEQAIGHTIEAYNLTKDKTYLEKAYYYSSRSKANILQNQIQNKQVIKATVTPVILRQDSTFQTNLHRTKSMLNHLPEKKDSLLPIYAKAQLELDQFLSDLERKNPEYYKEKYKFHTILSASDIQQQLGEQQLLIEYFLANSIIYVFGISKTKFDYHTISLTKAIEDQINSFTSSCTSPDLTIDLKTSHSLYQHLIEPRLNANKNLSEIIIVPDGILHQFPFEVLTDNRVDFLIETYSFQYSYSSNLSFSDQKSTYMSYAGFGTNYLPTLSVQLKNLTFLDQTNTLSQFNLSEEEITEVSKLFSGEVYLGENASITNFNKHPKQSDILHLSLHGLVDYTDPSKSCILFDNTQDDFILSPFELYNQNIETNLVVLSSCSSASGQIYKGEGVQGMSKAFILAGSKRVLSSLWNASERSSLDVLTTFFEHLKQGNSPSQSLRQSKLNYLEQALPTLRHPYYWSNYILIGKVSQSSSLFFKYTLYLATLILIGIIFYYVKSNKDTP